MTERKSISRAALVAGAVAAVVLAIGAAVASAAFITGTPGPDVLRGDPNGPSGDLIRGLGGDDRISGLARSDTLAGGPGNDTLIGGNGLDELRGSDGDDDLTGTVDRRPDQYHCGTGIDVIHVEKNEHSNQNFGPDCEIVETDHGG